MTPVSDPGACERGPEIRSLGWRDALIAGYLAVQLVVPARGLLWDRLEHPGRFSWNMYAHDRECVVEYTMQAPAGPLELDYRALFQRPEHASRVIGRQVLPEFHDFLCEAVRKRGFRGRIEARVACSLDGGPMTALVDPLADICTATNFGVLDGR